MENNEISRKDVIIAIVTTLLNIITLIIAIIALFK